jgi:signal transduction histidine kinase
MPMLASSPALISLAAASAAAWLWERARQRRASHRLRVVQESHARITRLLRLAASDQRSLALTLLGHAQRAQPADGALGGLAGRLLDMSDALSEQTESSGDVRYLSEEDVFLMPVLEFAVSQVAAQLGPGRRDWRIDPAFVPACLLADRRAMNQILVNVLIAAATTTREGDCIEIVADDAMPDWSIVIQDEGVGLPLSAQDGPWEDCRGIGLRLTLARSLMRAHGGSLTVDSAQLVGTRVRLRFPIARLLRCQRPDDPPEPASACDPLVSGRLASWSA